MTFFDFLSEPGMRPFEIAFAIVLGLLVLELVMTLMGLSSLGDSDSDLDLDVDTGEIDIDAVDLSGGGEVTLEMLESAELGPPAPESVDQDLATPANGGFILNWLGVGQVPMTIWFAGLLTGFALAGYGIQLVLSWTVGHLIGPVTASAIATPAALVFASFAARTLGRLVPKTQTTAIARRSYHRRRGIITVGTARAGRPAQVRFQDGFGNAHYTMVEPLDPKDTLPQGTEVMILRIKGGPPRAIALSETAQS